MEEYKTMILYDNLYDVFEEKNEKKQVDIGIIDNGKEYSYLDIYKKIEYYENLLVSIGVTEGMCVVISARLSVDCIALILAIHKIKGIYVPVNEVTPQNRLLDIIYDCRPILLVTGHKLDDNIVSRIQSCSVYNIICDTFIVKANKYIYNKISNKGLACIIYTSGTSGKPKGVMIKHSSIINVLLYLSNNYYVGNNNKMLCMTGIGFDVSITEIFGWFFNDSILVIGETEENYPEDLINNIKKYKITHINISPSALTVFLDKSIESLFKGGTLKYVISAGEELKPRIAKKFYDVFDMVNLENLYGPTETTIYATKYSVDKNYTDKVYIGKPIANTAIYIIDEKNNILDRGIGEICVAGKGLANGYLNNDKLTSIKFIDNPLKKNEKLYRTGDLGRFSENGYIEYLGRLDNQVQIRGIRVELGEIESKIMDLEFVKDVAVVVKEVNSQVKLLIAYIIANDNFDKSEVIKHLNNELPKYMIPNNICRIDKFPINSNGKLDIRNLPIPYKKENECHRKTSTDSIEGKLIEIWEQTFGIENFDLDLEFNEIGGNSLVIFTILAKIKKYLNIEIGANVFMDNSSIRKLCSYIRKQEEYKNKYNEFIHIFNKDSGIDVITFPPVEGTGLAYNRISKELKDISFISFDYLLDKDRINQYVKKILEINNKAIILMGWSSGGHIAYDVAVALENMGVKLSGIIVLDICPLESKDKLSDKELKNLEKEHMRNLLKNPSNREVLKSDDARLLYLSKLNSYLKYVNNLRYTKKLDTNIYVVVANKSDMCIDKVNTKKMWTKYTNGEVFLYDAVGTHNSILGSEVANNSKVIRNIIGKILVESKDEK